MANFLTPFAAAAGQSYMIGQQLADHQVSTDLKKQQLAMNKMQMLMTQRDLQTQQEINREVQSEFAKDATVATDPMKSAQVFGKAEVIAINRGNFKLAQQYSELAKGSLDRAKEGQKMLADQRKEYTELASKSALTYRDNPTPENAANVAAYAVRAGLVKDVKDVPPITSPQFASFAKSVIPAAQTTNEQLNSEEKVREFAQRQAETERSHRENEALRRDAAADRAVNREFMHQMALDRLELARERAAQAGTGGRAGQAAQMQMKRIVMASTELAESMHTISTMPMTTSGWGGLVHNTGTLFSATASTMAQQVTKDSQQQYQVAMSGVPRFIATLESMGAATGLVGLSKQAETLIAQPADTMGTTLRKSAEVRQIFDKAVNFIQSDSTVAPEMKELVKQAQEDMHKAVPFTNQELNELMKAQRSNPKMTAGEYFAKQQKTYGVGNKPSAVPDLPAGFTLDK